MEDLAWIFVAILVTISISVISCIVRGKVDKRLVLFSSMLSLVAMVCFGGQVVLNLFGMGWRCTPFNIMLMLCAILSIIILCCCIGDLFHSENTNIALTGFGFISMVLVISFIVIYAFAYFHLASWHDGLTTYNDQTIVYANDQHGGSCAWQYYTHINDLVHGVEILQEGSWRGNPPRLWPEPFFY